MRWRVCLEISCERGFLQDIPAVFLTNSFAVFASVLFCHVQNKLMIPAFHSDGVVLLFWGVRSSLRVYFVYS